MNNIKTGLSMLQNIKKKMFFILFIFCSCADYELLNFGEPDSVTLRISSATDSTVTLNWSKSFDTDFKNYKVFYSKQANVDINDSLADSLSVRPDTVLTVRGLTAATRYYFRVLVTTGRKLSSFSNEIDTVTLKDTITDTINHLKLFAPESITDSSVTLRWSRYKDFFDSYRIFGDTTWEVNFKDSVFATVYQDTTIVLPKLSKNKKYWFRVYAKKDTTYLAESNSVEVIVP
jgi:hypothetical protein